MGPVGRWQKGKDLSWYAKDKKSGASLSKEQEMAVVREAEHEVMLATLGHKTIKRQPTGLTKEDLADVCRTEGEADERDTVDRASGLGSSSTTKLIDCKKPVRRLRKPTDLIKKIKDLTERRRVKKKRKARRKKKEKTKHRSRSDSSDSDSESFSKRRRKDPRDHHGPNPSRSSQSGAGARDSHSRGGLKAEHRTLTPPHQHRRHDTDSSSDGHRAGRGSPAQSYRRRHDSSSDD
ncbi:multiple myeloma tumor-associated protein 2-like [Sinocyclocheilus anshuiensis]|uniref:multiple myeloma tumor-associated protein 2-like n=1 Tax=Sinocyclocheilus anshuiensis TaxID=1608454 RepID=UPI0007B9B3E2|nr:PREDICTED: multiple myeloma tumor-associated protein 2-like [Sinocyclocheilus anshuiensis]